MWSQVLSALLLVQVARAYSPPPGDIDKASPLDPPIVRFRAATTFKHLYVLKGGHVVSQHQTPSIEVAATTRTSDVALHKAANIVSLLVKNMPDEVYNGLTHSHGVGLFTKEEGLTVYPENQNLADTPACHGRCDGTCAHTCTFDGRKYEKIAALSNSRSVVLDLNVLCTPDNGYGRSENLLVHEFAHLVNAYMPQQWKDKIKAAYENAKTHRLWTLNTYGMANSAEYFGEATSSFFMSIRRTDVTGGMDMCGTSQPCANEAAARSYIQHHDPLLFDTLSYAFTNHRPHLPGHLAPCM